MKHEFKSISEPILYATFRDGQGRLIASTPIKGRYIRQMLVGESVIDRTIHRVEIHECDVPEPLLVMDGSSDPGFLPLKISHEGILEMDINPMCYWEHLRKS